MEIRNYSEEKEIWVTGVWRDPRRDEYEFWIVEGEKRKRIGVHYVPRTKEPLRKWYNHLMNLYLTGKIGV